jgi:hypothetical protein
MFIDSSVPTMDYALHRIFRNHHTSRVKSPQMNHSKLCASAKALSWGVRTKYLSFSCIIILRENTDYRRNPDLLHPNQWAVQKHLSFIPFSKSQILSNSSRTVESWDLGIPVLLLLFLFKFQSNGSNQAWSTTIIHQFLLNWEQLYRILHPSFPSWWLKLIEYKITLL